MRLSTHTRYAIRLVFELHLANAPVSIARLSEITHINEKLVETLHTVLKRNGITDSILGAHGGIRLAKPLSAISLGRMIDLFDDGVKFVVCFGDKSNNCPRQAVCETRSIWKIVSDRIGRELDGISLASILDQYSSKTEKASPMVIRCFHRKSDTTF